MLQPRYLPAVLVGVLLLIAAGWYGWNRFGYAEAAPTASSAPADLFEMADFVFEQIALLETKEDVVCWSSFCKLDNFIAQKPHAPMAVLEKIHSMQMLADRLWEKTSVAAEGAHITPEDLARVSRQGRGKVPLYQVRGGKEIFKELGFNDFTDYRTTSEHWRILLSVIQDAVCGIGLYEERPVLLKPLTPEAAIELSSIVSSLSLELLRETTNVSNERRRVHAQAPHVREAFERIAKLHALDAPPSPVSGRGESASSEAAKKQLGEREREFLDTLTRKLIRQKIESLKRYNAGAVEENVEQFINELSGIPVDKEGVQYLIEQLREFYMALASDCPGVVIDEVEDRERIQRVLPYRLLFNGDVVLRFGRSPGPGAAAAESDIVTITLIERDMDALRDNALHWQIMEDVWLAGKGKPLTPFAAEFISEAVSILATYYLVGAEELAEAGGRTVITTQDFAELSRMAKLVLSPEVPDSSWDETHEREKEALLKAYPPPLFADVTQASGIDFHHESNAKTNDVKLTGEGKPKYAGGGLAVGDVDGDGWLDVYLISGRDNKLYKGLGDGKFRDVTDEAGVADTSEGRSALFADVDNDGDLDLFLANAFGTSRLWENDGGGHFTDATAASGVEASPPVPGMSFFFDYDKDGDLDLFVGGYGPWDQGISSTLGGRNGYPNKLFENKGGLKFADVTERAGLGDTGWVQAAAAFDFDRDGDEDIFIANDFGLDKLFENRGDGTFRDASPDVLPVARGHGMNVSFVDVNADGFWDVFVSNIDMYSRRIRHRFPRGETVNDISDTVLYGFRFMEDCCLYVNKKGKLLEDKLDQWFEPGEYGWSWHAAFFDYENDGDADMYLANGWLENLHLDKNRLFLNHNRYFYLVDIDSPGLFLGSSRSFACFDMDHDGDLDLVVNNFHDKAVVLKNEQKGGNRWLKLRLRGKADNRNGVGAEVVVKAGNLVMRKHVTCGLGFLSQEPEILHFGLGQNDEADEIRVTWPNGTSQVVKNAASNALLTIHQGT